MKYKLIGEEYYGGTNYNIKEDTYKVFSNKEEIAIIQVDKNYIVAEQYGTIFYFKSLIGFGESWIYKIREYCLNEICQKLNDGLQKEELYEFCSWDDLYDD